MQLLKDILYRVLELQEKFLRFRLSKTIGAKTFSKSKRHFYHGCTLDLNTMADIEKQELEAKITNILKTYNYNPPRILEYIKSQVAKTLEICYKIH